MKALRAWVVLSLVGLAVVICARNAHALDSTETLYSVSCVDMWGLYVAVRGPVGDGVNHFAEVAAVTMRDLNAVYPAFAPVSLVSVDGVAAGSSSFTVGVYGGGVTSACTATSVITAAAHNFVPVTDALATLNTSVGAVTTQVTSMQGDMNTRLETIAPGSAENVEIDFERVGAFFGVCFAAVVGLYVFSYFAGQVISTVNWFR